MIKCVQMGGTATHVHGDDGIIADKLSAAGWSWGYCSAVSPNGWRSVVDAYNDGNRYIVESDELLTAFLELEAILLPSPILASNPVPNPETTKRRSRNRITIGIKSMSRRHF